MSEYTEVETVQDLINALMKVEDKSKKLVYRGWGGELYSSSDAPLSVTDHKQLVELE